MRATWWEVSVASPKIVSQKQLMGVRVSVGMRRNILITNGAPLWPSLHRHKRQMGVSGIYTRILQVTAKHLGCSINPHMFRDAAATFIAETIPERALLAAGVLQHRNLQITRKHYIRGQQHQMLHRYQSAIDALIADVTDEPLKLHRCKGPQRAGRLP